MKMHHFLKLYLQNAATLFLQVNLWTTSMASYNLSEMHIGSWGPLSYIRQP
jgi:hypothetical protein